MDAVSTHATRSPYLRDRLLQAVAGLRTDAETARLNLAEAEQDVAAARALLEEAEAHRDRAKAAVDGIAEGIAWAQDRAREITARIDTYDPAAKLAATGLMPREEPEPVEPDPVPYSEHVGHRVVVARHDSSLEDGVLESADVHELIVKRPGARVAIGQGDVASVSVRPPAHAVSATLYQDNGLPMIWDPSVPPGGYVCAMPHGPNSFGVVLPDGTRVCGMPVESEPCDLHGQPDDFAGNGKPVNGDNVTDLDDLPFNVVQAPADVIAAITGGTRVITDEPPRTDTVHTSGTGAGQLVATHGPTVTMPDTGLNPDPLPPAPPTAEPRHAKPDRPGLLARLTGGHRTIPDNPDGDDA